MEDRIKLLINAGKKERAARRQVLKETVRQRQLGEIRYDYRELQSAIKMMDQTLSHIRNFESSTHENYQHAGTQAFLAGSAALKASLLAGTQSITTNTWSGVLFGPAIIHVQTGQYLKALRDVLPFFVGGTPRVTQVVIKRVAAMVAGNKLMSKLLNKHAPLWNDLASHIIDQSNAFRRLEQIAVSSGMVSPYNLRDTWLNMGKLKTQSGRIVRPEDDQHWIGKGVNWISSTLPVRSFFEPLKATFPREFDNFINYTMVLDFEKNLDALKKLGWTAFQAREREAAATGADWKDLTQADNILNPQDIGLWSRKGLERYRQLFAPLGSLDLVLLDYYERTKAMTQEQRKAEPLIDNPDEEAAMALHWAATSNVATESTIPFSLKGKGSEGVLRSIVGTFMRWAINWTKQLSNIIQTHSKDPGGIRYANAMIGLATVILISAGIGAWNWEFGDELTKLFTEVSSARIQPGNIEDLQTALGYFAQALPNTVPIIGASIGQLAGISFTGRGNPFDVTSQILHLNLASDTWNTIKRIIQTGDVTLPLADYVRRWIPPSRYVLNRIPGLRGLVDQQNAVRSLHGSAPPGTEIQWGRGGAGIGAIKYSPANDEIMKLISSAYDVAARGESYTAVQQRLNEAVAAYVRTGLTEDEAVKTVGSALSSKEPIRILTGREMTADEEQRWLKRMTPSQKKDYDLAVKAWSVLGDVTGKDMNMVVADRGAGGGGTSGGGRRSIALLPAPAAISGGGGFGGGGGYLRISRPASFGSIRTRTRRLRSGLGRRRSLGRRTARLGPKISRRRGLVGRSRLRKALA